MKEKQTIVRLSKSNADWVENRKRELPFPVTTTWLVNEAIYSARGRPSQKSPFKTNNKRK